MVTVFVMIVAVAFTKAYGIDVMTVSGFALVLVINVVGQLAFYRRQP